MTNARPADSRPGSAIALIEHTQWGDAIHRYINSVQATFKPFGGRFRVHGGSVEVLKGQQEGTVVVVEFPNLAQAQQWYQSPAYQAILPLRADHTRGTVLLVEGVPPGYRAGSKLPG